MTETQIKKSLLILRSKPNTTTGAESFLRNREWSVHSTTNMKEFLTYIIQKKPSFVMISVDHTHKKIKVMPSIILQSFPVCVITFAESGSALSFRKLQEVSCEYRVNPPATGPAIERAVNKYLKDLERKQKEGTIKDSDGTGLENKSGSETVEIKGEKNAGTTTIHGSGGSDSDNKAWGQSSSLLSQLMDNDDSTTATGNADPGSLGAKNTGNANFTSDYMSEGGNKNATGTFVAYGEGKDGSGGFWAPDGSAKPQGNNPGSVTYNEDDFAGGFIGGEGAAAGGKANQDPNSNSQAGSLAGNFSTPTGFENDSNGAGRLTPGNGKDSFNHQKNDPNNSISKEQAGEGENFFNGRLEKKKQVDPNVKVITQMGRNTSSSMDSIILKGAKHALTESVEVHDGIVDQEIEDSSQVACIVVESERFSGYLIAAMGKNRKMDGKFIKTIQDKLFKFLNDNGENIAEKDNMQLKIKKVEFQDWAIEYGDFLKKSVHNGEEIAMAFFPVNQVKPEVGESAAQTMASVKLKDLDGDKPVDFNVYVYLPANKKYILYTPKGSKFYGNQKTRLEGKGVKEVHMLKSEVNDLTKYKAQNYLNNLIESYESKKKTSKAA